MLLAAASIGDGICMFGFAFMVIGLAWVLFR